jgi:hypothetical protein
MGGGRRLRHVRLHRTARRGVRAREPKDELHTPELAEGGQAGRGVSSRRPMPLNILECQVSKMVNSDTCPRPTTGDLPSALHDGGGHRRDLSGGHDLLLVSLERFSAAWSSLEQQFSAAWSGLEQQFSAAWSGLEQQFSAAWSGLEQANPGLNCSKLNPRAGLRCSGPARPWVMDWGQSHPPPPPCPPPLPPARP